MSKENVAKEYFEKYIKDFEKRIGKNLTTEFNEHLKVLLSRAEKQQKEIEEKNKDIKKLNDLLMLSELDYISKDKIREIISNKRKKVLEKHNSKLSISKRIYKRNVQVAMLDTLLKELLEE